MAIHYIYSSTALINGDDAIVASTPVWNLGVQITYYVPVSIAFSSSNSRDHTVDIDPQWYNMDCCI